MLQDIFPHSFSNEFKPVEPKESDYLFIFKDRKVIMNCAKGTLNLTTFKSLGSLGLKLIDKPIYLFSFDGVSVFASFIDKEFLLDEHKFIKPVELREIMPDWQVFLISTASHLMNWYSDNKYCGRCATPMAFSNIERALVCPNCGLVKYPTISPAIIVAVVDGDKILLTRYANRPYKKLSLVAGFTEIGETPEDTIKREVMEEVGLKVKNIKYYKSQPWAFSQSLLMGFWAELDGSSNVKVDKSELEEAIWYGEEDIPKCETTLSLTNEMIEVFRTQKYDKMSVL